MELRDHENFDNRGILHEIFKAVGRDGLSDEWSAPWTISILPATPGYPHYV